MQLVAISWRRAENPFPGSVAFALVARKAFAAKSLRQSQFMDCIARATQGTASSQAHATSLNFPRLRARMAQGAIAEQGVAFLVQG